MKLKELQKINNQVEVLAKKENKHFYFGRFIPNTKFVFVGEMPTDPKDWSPYDNFNLSASDKKFFDLLNKYGFGGSYITDIVKKTEDPRRPNEQELSEWLPLLTEEIRCINPDVAIAISKDTFETLNKNKDILGVVNLECIWHPSYVQRYNKWAEYENQIKLLSKRYNSGNE